MATPLVTYEVCVYKNMCRIMTVVLTYDRLSDKKRGWACSVGSQKTDLWKVLGTNSLTMTANRQWKKGFCEEANCLYKKN